MDANFDKMERMQIPDLLGAPVVNKKELDLEFWMRFGVVSRIWIRLNYNVLYGIYLEN
jgi:hypothetical protein